MADHDPKMRQAVVIVDDNGDAIDPRAATLQTGDIEIGAVELKNSTDDTRAVVTARGLQVESQGAVASAAADSGNPVKVGCKYNATLPSFTDGNRGDLQISSWGGLFVAARATGADGVGNGSIATLNNGSAGGVQSNNYLGVIPFKFNGTSWDRDVKPNGISRIISAANTTNPTSAKASAGNLHKIRGHNAKASAVYLKFYNKASAPTVGTDTPVMTIYLPASASFDIDFPNGGQYFSTGIAYGLTTDNADNGTTAVAAGDILGLNVMYS